MSVSLAFAIRTPSGLPPFVAWLVCTKIIVSASSWVQRVNSSRSIISGEIFFWYQWSYPLTVSETNAPVGWNFALVWHPSSHSRPRFSWLGNCHTIGPVGLQTLNTNVACFSNVLELLGYMVLMMAAWWTSSVVQAVSYCVITHVTSGPVPIQFGRIFSHTKCSTISLYDCVRLHKSLVNNYGWELSARFMHNDISVQKSWAIWGCFCWVILSL